MHFSLIDHIKRDVIGFQIVDFDTQMKTVMDQMIA
jgi:hypothetical protein